MLKRGKDALDELDQLMHHQHLVGPSGGLPSVTTPGHTPVDPEPWLWSQPGTPVLPLTDPAAYALEHRECALHVAPAAAEEDEDLDFPWFARNSVDVTMRGGTTSGVVYPLAVCEIARHFRLRNVGGASAGAIAASCAAAAEVGRTRWDHAGQPSIDPPEDRAAGNLRQGFAGLADAVAWYCQLDDRDTPDQRRIAQLFQPTVAGHRLFRLFMATMQERRKVLRVAILSIGAFGRVSKLITWGVLLGVLAWFVCQRDEVLEGIAPPWLRAVLAVAVTGAWSVGLALLVIGAAVLARSRPPAELQPPEPVPASPPPDVGRGLAPLLTGLVLVLAVVVVTSSQSGVGDHWDVPLEFLGVSLLVWATAVLLLATSTLGGAGVIALTAAKKHGFGLVAGTGRWHPTWLGRIWNRVAGLPTGSEAPTLIAWLDRSLSQLAGQDGPLLFRDLWSPVEGYGDAAATGDVSRRSVNLELVTTELVHGVPHRFPQPETPSAPGGLAGLWVRADDLKDDDESARVFPARIIELLKSQATFEGACDTETGKPLGTLYRLPEAGDLPVIVAVRLSMSLPGLFEAIRFYQVIRTPGHSQHVRDEFGRTLLSADGDDDQPAQYPEDTTVAWAEELWFTDGGVTQNFPIHLFDSVLPSWPTLGINLGGYPRGHRHQDVWAPDDAGSRTSPPAPQSSSVLGFFGAIVSTARGWSDTRQTFMPAMRGRVAWVRQSSQEGGTNLLMSRETIAALALRGALAGQRLAHRYASDEHWRRHQWLRLRVGAANLAQLQRSLGRADRAGAYTELLEAASLDPWRDGLQEAGGDPTLPDQLAWFPPEQDPSWPADLSFWTEASDLVDGVLPERATSTGGGPEPSPDLRQVPGS